MKLFAQVGYGLGDKVNDGLSERLIDGAIFSPKDLKKETMICRLDAIRSDFPNAELFFDPQYYMSLYANSPSVNLGNIPDWRFFLSFRKGELELTQTVERVLQEYYQEVISYGFTGIIAPNIYISQSFDSREAVIAKNFIRLAKPIYKETNDDRALYASLIVCREALQDNREFEEFLNDITLLDDPPDGFYVVVASRSSDARSDIFHTDIVANWMMLNFSLSLNGFRVINGYSDTLTPFLGLAGGSVGSTGWWSNLRFFSLDRFFPASGGRLPITRYLSKQLLNRITFSEKEALSRFLPKITNDLPHDVDYDPEPERSQEIMQSWEALKSLNNELLTGDFNNDYNNCTRAIKQAMQLYEHIATLGIIIDHKSRDDHLVPLLDGLHLFKERAEL